MDGLYEKGREQLIELIKWYIPNKGKRNEATTRLHLIDRILFEVLQWKRENVTAEDSYDGEYTDYTLRNTRALAIIEAKKEGNYFDLPVGNMRVKYSLKGLYRDYPNLKEALDQVSSYCSKRGVQIGMISNGWQFLVFVANRTDGIAPLEGKAFVFESLEFMLENYPELWNAASYAGIHEKYAQRHLLGEDLPILPPKLSASIQNYPGYKNRNPFQTDMEILSDLVLEDIIREKEVEEEFLRQCYAKSGALSQYATVSKEILNTRYKFLFEADENPLLIQKAVEKRGLNPDLREIIANSLSRRPIILVGDVGVGKTSFINNLIQVEAVDLFTQSISIKIDLGTSAVLQSDINTAIFDAIYEILENEYEINIDEDGFIRGTYRSELQKFRKGINKRLFEINPEVAEQREIEYLSALISDKPNHVKKSLEHLSKLRRKQIVIFIDNCDQRSDDVQQNAFLASQEIAEKWPALVFVTVRPETFHRSLKSGALSGYHPKAFTISPPRLDEVLQKRISYASKITKGEIPVERLDVTAKLSSLETLLKVFSVSLEKNQELIKFLDNISNGNIRIAIDYVKQFFGSGHVDTRKILEIFDEQGFYIIPLHEFIRAIMRGNNIHFNPNTSSISNLFDVIQNDTREHFLLPTLLSLLQAASFSGTKDGFLSAKQVYTSLQGIGFNIIQIDDILMRCFENGLVESSRKGDIIEESNFPSMLRITTLGSYHITNLIHMFSYIDSIIVDTPIFKDEIRDRIITGGAIDHRLERAAIFIQYLDEMWDSGGFEESVYNWNSDSSLIKREMEEIWKRI